MSGIVKVTGEKRLQLSFGVEETEEQVSAVTSALVTSTVGHIATSFMREQLLRRNVPLLVDVLAVIIIVKPSGPPDSAIIWVDKY